MNNEEMLYNLVLSGEWKIDQNGYVWMMKKGVWKRAEHRTPQGYLQVRKMIKGIRVHTGAHRLVYRHFHGKIQSGITINHLNGKKDDNRPENLEIATYSENIKHAFLLGLANQDGEKNPASKLSNLQVEEIRSVYAAGNITQIELAQRYNVAIQTISQIVRGERRQSQSGITSDYTKRRQKKMERNSKGQFIK